MSGEFQVNSYTPGTQLNPTVAMDNSGFVVVWEAVMAGPASIFGRRFASTGNPVGGQFMVNTNTVTSQGTPAVASDGAGNAVVVWQGQHDGSSGGIFARRFDAAGNALAAEFQVNVITAGSQGLPDVARSAAGFVVSWSSNGIRARLFNPGGTLASAEIPVNAFTGSVVASSVAMGNAGDFVVVWDSYGQDGQFSGVFGRRFDSDGMPSTPDVQVNSFFTDVQFSPDVSMAGSRFVVTWISRYQDDPSSYGVFGQRFRTAELGFDVDGNGAVEPLTDTLLLLRYAFGFRGAVLVTGAVGPGCTRCTASAIEEYLAGEF